MPHPSAFQGLRVLDLTHHIAGPFCTKLLADFGAGVLKIERPPRGDQARYAGPFPHDEPHPEKSGLFLYLNTNKQSIADDLRQPEGRQLILDLVKERDVVVESFRPGVMDRLGLSYDALRAVQPGLVMVSISNFGQTGPYRDYRANELVAYAMGGPMQSTGTPDRAPVKLGGNIGLYETGEAAALAAALAVFRRDFDGQGDRVDISIFETQLTNQDRRSIFMLNHQYTGQVVKRHDDTTGLAFGIFPCRDGHLCFWSGANRFPRVAAMVGRPELVDEPAFAAYETGVEAEAVAWFNGTVLLPWLLERDMRQAWIDSQAFGLATAPITSPGHFFDDPYFRERGFWDSVDHPAAGLFDYPGAPFLMSATPRQAPRPAPLLGQHTEDVLRDELGYVRAKIDGLRARGVVA